MYLKFFDLHTDPDLYLSLRTIALAYCFVCLLPCNINCYACEYCFHVSAVCSCMHACMYVCMYIWMDMNVLSMTPMVSLVNSTR